MKVRDGRLSTRFFSGKLHVKTVLTLLKGNDKKPCWVSPAASVTKAVASILKYRRDLDFCSGNSIGMRRVKRP